jgi:transcriptional regulator GlxA family with amidase domain
VRGTTDGPATGAVGVGQVVMNADGPLPGGRRLKIGFVLARSFTLSAFALFIDTLRLAGDELDRSRRINADWQVLGSTRNPIMSSCGVQVLPTSHFAEPGQFDYIVVVGGVLRDETPPVDQETMDFLKRAAASRVPLIGLCTGTFVLAAAGLMRRHRTCVSWLHYGAFRERFPDHQVDAGSLFNLEAMRGSCAGGSSSADIAALIVRRHIGRSAEKNALEVLQIDRARSPFDVQPRKPMPMECDDRRLRKALIVMEQNLENRMAIADLAAAVGLSRRQLERLFKSKAGCSPSLAYKKVGMERAKRLVLQSQDSLLDIAVEVGISNASQFAKDFRQIHGRPPSAFRMSQAR